MKSRHTTYTSEFPSLLQTGLIICTELNEQRSMYKRQTVWHSKIVNIFKTKFPPRKKEEYY